MHVAKAQATDNHRELTLPLGQLDRRAASQQAPLSPMHGFRV